MEKKKQIAIGKKQRSGMELIDKKAEKKCRTTVLLL